MEPIYKGKTYIFDTTISVNGTPVNITSDSVIVKIARDKDGVVEIQANADVTTSGASGIAKFTLSETLTNIQTGRYNLQVEWQLVAGNKFIVTDEKIQVKQAIGL